MIQFIIAILLGLACSSGSTGGSTNDNDPGYSTYDTGGENGQIPPPPITDPEGFGG